MDGIDAEELEKLPGMICFLFIYWFMTFFEVWFILSYFSNNCL
jgi:hypothetical protein